MYPQFLKENTAPNFGEKVQLLPRDQLELNALALIDNIIKFKFIKIMVSAHFSSSISYKLLLLFHSQRYKKIKKTSLHFKEIFS